MITTYPIAQYATVMALPGPKDVLIEGDTIIVRTGADMPPEPEVRVITPRQARLALLQAGKLDAVEAALRADTAARITWEYALEIHRDDPLVNAIGAQLGLSSAEIDALFRAAAKL